MDRLERALAAAKPPDALWELARELQEAGTSREKLLALFDAARERHENDADETCYDAILDTIDCIVGWCASSQRIYPEPGEPTDLSP